MGVMLGRSLCKKTGSAEMLRISCLLNSRKSALSLISSGFLVMLLNCPSPAVNATGLALLQRQFRQAEVDETIRVLQSINNGQGDAVYQNSSRGEGQTLSGWKGILDFEKLVVGGHSFGATSAVGCNYCMLL